ncbi:MAG: ATP-binding cassette domain-containing protein [Candidatus Paracaedibacteraceae bacterium]|nr:ATP-binding cassette domain-containing protein [Candidatus Paracaedibacteraceae bacterium]
MREKSSVEYTTKSQRPSSNNMAILSHFLPFLLRYKRQLFLGTISLVLASISVLGLGLGLKGLVDQAFSQENSYALDQAILFMLMSVIIMALSSFGRTYYVSWLGEKVMSDVRERVYNHLLTLDVGYFEAIRPGEIISRLSTDTTLIQILIGNSAALAIRNLLLFVGGVAMMLTMSLKLSALSLLIIPMVITPLLAFGKRVKANAKTTQDAVANLSGYLEESLSSIRTCHAFQREDYDVSLFKTASNQAFLKSNQYLLNRSWLVFLVMTFVFIGISGLLWIGGQDVLNGTLSAGQLTSFLFYALTAAGSIASFSEIYADIQRASGAAERLVEILETSPRIQSQRKRVLPSQSRGTIALHNVCFSYPTNPGKDVLKNVTLSIAPGEKVALVGPSGAGKSTVLSLLLRFYDATAGSIYVDGVDTKDVDISELRSRFGIVPQDPMIFSGTLYENIMYAKPDASETEVWNAIEAAYLMDVIQGLPQGIHTQLGAKGMRLSGGQKQRLALARVFLRDAPILLLDEATSSLDAQSESFIQESLKNLMMKKTTLVVAHRLSTVLKSDKIIVLNAGKIEAIGTHAELIANDGLYRKLAMLQFTDSLNVPDNSKARKALWA